MKITCTFTTIYRLAFLLAFLVAGPSVSFAQDFFDYVKEVEYGGGLLNVAITDPLLIAYDGDTISNGQERSALGFASTVGLNFPLYHPDTGSAIGIAPSLELAFSLGPLFGSDLDYFSAGLPLMITYKRGGDAEYHNQKGFGFTVGLGGIYGAYLTSNTAETGSSGESPFITYAAPIGMIEVNYAKRNAIVKLRVQSMFTGTEDSDRKFTFFQQGIYLIFSNGFWSGGSSRPR
jgi:hypothetical protein